MLEDYQIDFDQPVPLFPLPACVLLPHVTIPLHIFEHRYRTMMHAALASDQKLIAMALFAGDDWRDHYEGNPAIRPIVGVGRVAGYEQLPDGRFNVSLHGLARARIVQETDCDPYRVADLQPTERGDVMEIDLAEQRECLHALLTNRCLRQWAPVAAIGPWLDNESSTLALIDLAAMHVCDLEQRYEMLAEADPFARAAKLIAVLKEARTALETAQHNEPPESDDRINLN